MKGNDKPAILAALISSNNKVWGEFCMHPLKTNMRLATAAATTTMAAVAATTTTTAAAAATEASTDSNQQ